MKKTRVNFTPTLFFIKLSFISLLGVHLSGCSTATMQKDFVSQKNVGRTPASHSWGGYHWARTTPQFTLQLGDNLTSSSWKGHLSQSAINWNSPEAVGASSTPLLSAVVSGKSSSRRCAMREGTTQVCNDRYGKNGWLGLASIYIINGEHIIQGSAKMNDTYFDTSKYNNPNEKLHVMCQEVAHTFGLAHQSEDGSSQNSCMDYFSNTGVNATSTQSTRPNVHDFEQLNQIYEHLDTTTTVASTTTPALASEEEVSDDPKTWGQFISEMSHGQSAYYERSNRDGSKTVTHVYWTLETAARCNNNKGCDHRYDH